MAELNSCPREVSKKTRHTDDLENKHQKQYQYTIRPATEEDLQYLPDIEDSAGTLFRNVPELARLADDEPTSVQQHKAYLVEAKRKGFDGGVIIAIPRLSDSQRCITSLLSEPPVAFVATALLACAGTLSNTAGEVSDRDRNEVFFLHIHEMSVHIAHQRRGLAGRLLVELENNVAKFNQAKAGEKIIAGTTLTTFRDVAFNAPFYRRCGFRELPAQEIENVVGGDGVAIWTEEQNRFKAGSLARIRCWMVK